MTSTYILEKAMSSKDDVITADESVEGFCDGDNQQRASTSRGNLKLAIEKRCRSNKLVRQRFAFALRFSRWFRAKNQQALHSISEESSSGTSSSSESKDEVQCLMVDDTDEIFNFSNLEFTREDLVTTLNDMVQEYKKLSKSFEEVKAEIESYATKAELVSSSNMQAALSKLATENDELRSMSQEMLNANQWLAGYDDNDSNTAETSSTPQLARTKFRTINFVKSSTGQPVEEQCGE
ncbi:hypothetical protein F511_27107 [Dorcoceras hygrometricum]|uniref:Uncharacterized protein n=1 Tax=Dorcoceras hygrometricum TaxID=472368 RepID=A0A2Z7D8I2_9LAMI|nr:hypothetical protein F511_27107 [Dorcoceras hygrometricum]